MSKGSLEDLDRGMPEPWVRQVGETIKAYEAFEAYLALGPKRSLAKAFEQKSGKTATAAPGHWTAWSGQHSWNARAKAWDDAVALAQRTAALQEAEEHARAKAGLWSTREDDVREKEYSLAMKILIKLEAMVAWPIATREVDERDKDGRPIHVTYKPTRWNAGDMARLLEAASRTARLSAEMSTSNDRLELVARQTTMDILAKLEQHLPDDLFELVHGILLGDALDARSLGAGNV